MLAVPHVHPLVELLDSEVWRSCHRRECGNLSELRFLASNASTPFIRTSYASTSFYATLTSSAWQSIYIRLFTEHRLLYGPQIAASSATLGQHAVHLITTSATHSYTLIFTTSSSLLIAIFNIHKLAMPTRAPATPAEKTLHFHPADNPF